MLKYQAVVWVILVECLCVKLSCENIIVIFFIIISKLVSMLTCLLIALNVYLLNYMDTSYYTTICRNCCISQINIPKTHKSNTLQSGL